MKRLFDIKNITAFLVVFLAMGTTAAFAQNKKPVLKHKPVARKKVATAIPLYPVETGTTIRVRLNQTLSSKTARVGNTFTATVTEPVYATNGAVVIPVGSTVTGRVDAATPAAKGGKPGSIDCSFTQVRLPNGYRRAINGSLAELSDGGTNSDNEGTATGKTMGHRKLIFIGGGAAGGAVLGAAIGGGKGALIGGIIGGAGGFLGDRYTKGKEAQVKSGTEFGVLLNRGISMPKYHEVTP